MNEDEMSVLSKLGEAWNAFLHLKEIHSADRQDFVHAIHAAQNIILARAGHRDMNTGGLEQPVGMRLNS